MSLTERCNFRCPYCMPQRPDFMDRKDRLDASELRRLLTLFVRELGIQHLRLTGGEPSLRADLEIIIAECRPLRSRGLQRVSITINGSLLASRAQRLRVAASTMPASAWMPSTMMEDRPVLFRSGRSARAAAGNAGDCTNCPPEDACVLWVRSDRHLPVPSLYRWARNACCGFTGRFTA
jgi:hypothetical protein